MEMMFSVDQAENDRLLLDEEYRRQDLLDTAVQSFAPHLLNSDGVKSVHLYSTNDSLRKAIREAFKGGKTIVVEHCVDKGRSRTGVNEVPYTYGRLTLPEKADLVVTKSNLNSKMEWFAAGLSAMVVVLPEGLPYVFKRLERVRALILVGADQGKS